MSGQKLCMKNSLSQFFDPEHRDMVMCHKECDQRSRVKVLENCCSQENGAQKLLWEAGLSASISCHLTQMFNYWRHPEVLPQCTEPLDRSRLHSEMLKL